ncbi:MAG TPA: dienelactone hydrolase family protein [Gemmatimonas sp.]|nr:dienelactone hydrolase family protein [Gemmatimonas sp.]
MTYVDDPHAGQSASTAGVPLDIASYAIILVHGRGGTPEGMLPVARAAGASDGFVIAPRAAGGEWYPQRFLAPVLQNEPWLSSALEAIDATVQYVCAGGVPKERIVLAGFSQGACLALEYVARHPERYGGVAALAGALIGDPAQPRHDLGSLAGTPVLLACGDADEHIPEPLVREAARIFAALDSAVDLRVYPGLGHSITGDQLDALRDMLDVVRSTAPAG